MFGWRLKAVNVGVWKTSARYLIFFVIERQCFICRLGMDGNLGSYGVANTGRLFSFEYDTFLRNFNFSLGILLALVKADRILSFLYPLFNKRSCSSCNLLSLMLGLEQILEILIANDFGMARVVCLGWQLLGSKYWFLSVGFIHKSV